MAPTWLTSDQMAEFEHVQSDFGLPEAGSRMLTREFTGQDMSDGWVIVQDGVYRYAVAQYGTMIVRTVLYDFLATEVFWDD